MAVKMGDKLIFTNQFASMMRSSLPLVDVLDNLARETPSRELREVLEFISEDVHSGVEFGNSLAEFPKVFDEMYVNVVRAGMTSGRLAESLTQIAEYLVKVDAIGQKLRGALSYPIFMGIAFFGVFNAMVFFILPRFAVMFASFGKKLPVPTQILMAVGDFWANNWYFIITSLVISFVGWIVWITTDDGRFIWDQYKLKVPLVGRLWRLGALARFSRTFAVQLENDVRLLDALELAAGTTGNRFMEETLYWIVDDISRGVSVAHAFGKHDVFSGIVLQMISAGEEAGTLNELLLSAADYFERLLDNEIQMVTGLINPILTVVMGLAIAGMMIAAFLPVFDMGKNIS